MSDELSVVNSGLMNLVKDSGIGDVIKPLTKEIHLFDAFVSGTSRLRDASVLDNISIGGKLKMRREDNKFDSNAIVFLDHDNNKIGYVPEKDNVVFARLLDAGKLLSATVTGIERKGSFTKIAVSIFLVDI